MPAISRTASFAAGALLAASTLAAGSAVASTGQGNGPRSDVIRASIQGSILSDPPLFGVTRGGLPWVISDGTARLRADGGLQVEVEGLIVPDLGRNPLTALSASVACNGTVVATTAPVPFSADGNATVDATVALPARCLAPAVLLNPGTNAGVYIAVTGR